MSELQQVFRQVRRYAGASLVKVFLGRLRPRESRRISGFSVADMPYPPNSRFWKASVGFLYLDVDGSLRLVQATPWCTIILSGIEHCHKHLQRLKGF
jgi:hypothetical protein